MFALLVALVLNGGGACPHRPTDQPGSPLLLISLNSIFNVPVLARPRLVLVISHLCLLVVEDSSNNRSGQLACAQ